MSLAIIRTLRKCYQVARAYLTPRYNYGQPAVTNKSQETTYVVEDVLVHGFKPATSFSNPILSQHRILYVRGPSTEPGEQIRDVDGGIWPQLVTSMLIFARNTYQFRRFQPFAKSHARAGTCIRQNWRNILWPASLKLVVFRVL